MPSRHKSKGIRLCVPGRSGQLQHQHCPTPLVYRQLRWMPGGLTPPGVCCRSNSNASGPGNRMLATWSNARYRPHNDINSNIPVGTTSEQTRRLTSTPSLLSTGHACGLHGLIGPQTAGMRQFIVIRGGRTTSLALGYDEKPISKQTCHLGGAAKLDCARTLHNTQFKLNS